MSISTGCAVSSRTRATIFSTRRTSRRTCSAAIEANGRGTRGGSDRLAHLRALVLLRQFAHDLDEVRLALKADAGQIRHHDVAVQNPHAVRKAARGRERVRIASIAAKTEARRDVERHLVAAMRDAAAR